MLILILYKESNEYKGGIMLNKKTKNIKLVTLFNMVKQKTSKEVEDYIYYNKIDLNSKNDDLKASVLTSINTGMMDEKTYNRSNENALFAINNLTHLFYENFRGNYDILETYILNHYKDKENGFIDEIINEKIKDKYKDDENSLQIDLLNTIDNLIKHDNLDTIISKSITNFFFNIDNLNEHFMSSLNPKILQHVMLYDSDYQEANNNDKKIIKNMNLTEKLSNVIFSFSQKYDDNSFISFILSFFNKDGSPKIVFSTNLFKPLIYLSSTSILPQQVELICNIFNSINHEEYPLEFSNLDQEFKNVIDKIKFKYPNIHADIVQYMLKSTMYIKSKNTENRLEIINSNLRKIRL